MSTPELLGEVLPLLERLVAFDTQNPPRAVDEGGIVRFLVETLGPTFRCTVTNRGDGCITLLAMRGTPNLLFNVHLDTVPADPHWPSNPHRLRVEGDRAVGLGAADIKGAAACLLVAARRAAGDVALLFNSDEEAGSSRCVKGFLAEAPAFQGVVVAEPTRCQAVLEHRGIATCAGEFHGLGGHAASPRALQDSALHEAVRWAARALAFAEQQERRHYKSLSGIRFNLGTLSGGTKANMIAASTALRFGVRPLPDQRPEEVMAALTALAPHADRVTWTPGFLAPPLPARSSQMQNAEALATALGVPISPPVDYWTEAALFSAAAIPAIVYGPGDIAQAHTAGEWVLLAELAEALATYQRILSRC